MWWLGGHLGAAVSALVDGQLDDESSERAWAHVAGCETCRRQVEREGWVKRRLATMAGNDPAAPPSGLVGSLVHLAPPDRESPWPQPAAHGVPGRREVAEDVAAAWVAVDSLERRSRPRRRAGLALAGAGSVSVAVLGLSTLGATPLEIGGGTPTTPAVRSATPSPAGGPATGPAYPVTAPASARVASTPSAVPSADAPPAAPGLPTSGPFTQWRLGVAGDTVNRTLPVGLAR